MAADRGQSASMSQTLEFHARANKVEGMITLHNPGNETLTVRSVVATGVEFRDRMGQTIEQIPILARIRSGQSRSCNLEFDLDPAFPAGTYQGDLVCGDLLRQPFILHVPERLRITLSPRTIVIHRNPGQVLTQQLVVTNTGNVPAILNKEFTLGLSEVNAVHRSISSAIQRSGKEGYTKVLDDIVSQLAASMVRPLVITVQGDNLELLPGETRKFDISGRVPQNIKHNRTYKGSIDILGRKLGIILDTTQATSNAHEVRQL